MNNNQPSNPTQAIFPHKEKPIHLPRKRVDIVSIKLVKESSLLYERRSIRSPEDGYNLAKQYLGDVDREHFVVASLDTKNNPTNITTCHIGSLNSSIVSVREVFKTAILANSASIMCFHNHPSNDPLNIVT